MLSVIPYSSSPTPKRLKLALQTSMSLLPLMDMLCTSLDLPAASPAFSSTNANACEPLPSPTSPSGLLLEMTFLFSQNFSLLLRNRFLLRIGHRINYPFGSHSILHDCPLPPRHISGGSVRRTFPPFKRVTYQEILVDTSPIPIWEIASDEDNKNIVTEEEQLRRQQKIQAADGHIYPSSR